MFHSVPKLCIFHSDWWRDSIGQVWYFFKSKEEQHVCVKQSLQDISERKRISQSEAKLPANLLLFHRLQSLCLFVKVHLTPYWQTSAIIWKLHGHAYRWRYLCSATAWPKRWRHLAKYVKIVSDTEIGFRHSHIQEIRKRVEMQSTSEMHSQEHRSCFCHFHVSGKIR